MIGRKNTKLTQIHHNMFVPEEEHNRTRIVQLVHFVEIRCLKNVRYGCSTMKDMSRGKNKCSIKANIGSKNNEAFGKLTHLRNID